MTCFSPWPLGGSGKLLVESHQTSFCSPPVPPSPHTDGGAVGTSGLLSHIWGALGLGRLGPGRLPFLPSRFRFPLQEVKGFPS